MVYSWYLSYPLSVDSVDDVVFNHVSVLYWFSLPLLLTSLYMLAVTSKSNYLKWIMTVGVILTMYSLSYFYFMLPTADSTYFRGLNEYFMETKNLDPIQSHKVYLQWPSYFILTNIATSVSGLQLATFESLIYILIGFQILTSLYVYASKSYRNGAFLAVITFFIAMSNYLNYQAGPYSTATSLLFLAFALETLRKSSRVIITMLVLVIGMTITHAFVPLLFFLYLLIRFILSRGDRQYFLQLSLLSLIVYLCYQITLAASGFGGSIWSMFNLPPGLTPVVKAHFEPVIFPIDAIAQRFSAFVLITTVTICVAGFVFLFFKRKLRDLDKAIFLAGSVYSGLGVVLWLLGWRAIPMAFIPISLGGAYLFQSRFRPYLKCLLLVLLVLFSFIPLHLSFFSEDIHFQTREAYTAQNFFIDHYNWTKRSFILASLRVREYIEMRMIGNASYFSSRAKTFKWADTIIHTIALERELISFNYTVERIINEEKLNLVYNNGLSKVVVRG